MTGLLRERGRDRTKYERAQAAREIVGVDGSIIDERAEDEERGREINAQVEVGVVFTEHARDRATKMSTHVREQ